VAEVKGGKQPLPHQYADLMLQDRRGGNQAGFTAGLRCCNASGFKEGRARSVLTSFSTRRALSSRRVVYVRAVARRGG